MQLLHIYTCGFRINANLLMEGSSRINARLVKEGHIPTTLTRLCIELCHYILLFMLNRPIHDRLHRTTQSTVLSLFQPDTDGTRVS